MIKKELDKAIDNGIEIPKGLLIGMKDIGRKTKMFFIREKWTFMRQTNLKEKVFLIERLRKIKSDKSNMAYGYAWKEGDIEYRISYWIIGQIGNRKNKWTFGSFCPIIPKKDFSKLISKAKEKGTIL
ncbi:MAG TPA: hypothetical protein PK367_02910 [Candidatus Paceibacterota bacterium]|nr:hypothetical protein [Candidatus Paceibacterota bacterium]